MAKVCLHIGAHKTGTTSLQHALLVHESALRAHGALYPESARFHFAQHRLAFALNGMRDRRRGDLPDFEREMGDLLGEIEISGCRSAIVSSEELFSITPRSIAALAGALEGHDVRVVATIRRPDELFISSYNQKIKTPGNRFCASYAEFLDSPRTLIPDIDYRPRLEGWADAFGKGNMKLLCYEDGPVVDEVLAIAGVPSGIAGAVRRGMNRSISITALEVMRLAKSMTANTAVLRRVLERAIQLYPTDRPHQSLLSGDERRRLIAALEEDNAVLFEQFLGSPNRYSASELLDGARYVAMPMAAGEVASCLIAALQDAIGESRVTPV